MPCTDNSVYVFKSHVMTALNPRWSSLFSKIQQNSLFSASVSSYFSNWSIHTNVGLQPAHRKYKTCLLGIFPFIWRFRGNYMKSKVNVYCKAERNLNKIKQETFKKCWTSNSLLRILAQDWGLLGLCSWPPATWSYFAGKVEEALKKKMQMPLVQK